MNPRLQVAKKRFLFVWKFCPIPEYPTTGLFWQAFVVILSLVLLEYLQAVPGVAIGVLALVALLVTIRAENGWERWEQRVWILIAFVLFTVEIRSIYHDRDEFSQHEADRRKEENEHHEQQMSKLEQVRLTQASQFQVNQALLDHPSLAVVPSANKVDLRTRSLLLARNMLNFILDRQEHDVFAGKYPNFIIVGGGESNRKDMPPYGRETLSLFGQRFEPELKNIRDEFSARGLGEWTTLDGVAKESPEAIGGNPYAALRKVADDIRTLASLLPPPGMLDGVSSFDLAEMADDESKKIDGLASAALAKIYQGQDESARNATRAFFGFDFDSCCRDQVASIRNEVMARLGPVAKNVDEMTVFSQLMEASLQHNDGIVTLTKQYAPYLKLLSEQLKAKSGRR